ncbi:MAG TPA: hypothetical protein VFQ22_05790 [Longimicrobiales bacterium]|nr:hypothetical protein [Longimicrobiales bacterium]
MLRAGRVPLLLGALLGCAPVATAGPACRPTAEAVALPDELAEVSGVAVATRAADVLWTHGDDEPALYAVNAAGKLLGRHPLDAEVHDWEDVEAAPCRAHGSCLYLADTGDNVEQRPVVHILRTPEPDAARPGPLAAEVFPVRFPDGPRDVEALFVLPGERVHVVSKGRRGPVTVYRYPGALRPDTVTLEEVQRLTDGPAMLLDQVTGASASRDGSLVAVRTYQALRFYHVEEGRLEPAERGLVNLRPLREIQGEGVALGPDGLVALTSEGGPLGGPASLRTLRCDELAD